MKSAHRFFSVLWEKIKIFVSRLLNTARGFEIFFRKSNLSTVKPCSKVHAPKPEKIIQIEQSNFRFCMHQTRLFGFWCMRC